MRFRFRGLYRENARLVEGHVEAPEAEAAYQVLSERGIVTESLEGDPDSALHSQLQAEPFGAPDVSLFENSLEEALESALDSSSTKVSFDALTKLYRGKKVRVIDRDKIRARVAELVDSTLAESEAKSESGETARERVANAINGLFHDSRNVSTEKQITDPGLAAQIGRLSGVVEQAEGLISAMQSALRNVEAGGAPRRAAHVLSTRRSGNSEQAGVLHEILQSNLELRRAMAGESNKNNSTTPNVEL